MRPVIVSNIMSLDGFYEGPGQNVMALNMDEAFDRYNLERIRSADVVLLGRKSYEGFSSYWPAIVDAPADPTNRELSDDNRGLSRIYNLIGKVGFEKKAASTSPFIRTVPGAANQTVSAEQGRQASGVRERDRVGVDDDRARLGVERLEPTRYCAGPVRLRGCDHQIWCLVQPRGHPIHVFGPLQPHGPAADSNNRRTPRLGDRDRTSTVSARICRAGSPRLHRPPSNAESTATADVVRACT
jgi:hypothetical protein